MSMRRRAGLAAALSVALALGGCAGDAPHGRAIYVLIDTSASYRPALARAVAGAKRIVARARPGDVLAIALITAWLRTITTTPIGRSD